MYKHMENVSMKKKSKKCGSNLENFDVEKFVKH